MNQTAYMPHVAADTHLSLSSLFISNTGTMTEDARARQGRRLWLARLKPPPIITMKREDAEALPIFYWANKLTEAQRCKYYKRIHIFSTLLLTLTIRH